MKRKIGNVQPQGNSNYTLNEMSLIMGVGKTKHEYAIQSIPHQIHHKKSAFNNYFNSTSTAGSNKLLGKTGVNSEIGITRANWKIKQKSYDNSKTTLPKILKNIVQRRLAYFLSTISSMQGAKHEVEKEVEISVEQNFIQIKSLLVSPRNQPAKQTSCSWADCVGKKRSFPILNKLLLTDGKDILRNCISKQNRFHKPKQCQDRPFSILNKC